MNEKRMEEIANAVLYEGYMLYPYRPSSVKNRQRWNFGVVYPRNYSEFQVGSDPWFTQTECLVIGSVETELKVKVRFLRAISRTIGELDTRITEMPAQGEPAFHPIASLRVGEQLLQTWQEAAERDVTATPRRIEDLLTNPVQQSFELVAQREIEPVRDSEGRISALIIRTQEPVSGKLEVRAAVVKDGVYKITLRVSNQTMIDDVPGATRDHALLQSLISAHSILSVEHGEFASLLETAEDLRDQASSCRNIGTWPVLVGEEGQRDAMVSSPIILYDYPQIAPESAGDLFDGTEIDEILALRILTLTEDEKREMREGDDRARQILERTEALPAEQFAKLHGTLRGLRPSSEGRQ